MADYTSNYSGEEIDEGVGKGLNIPNVTSDDEDKVLKVINGQWDKGEASGSVEVGIINDKPMWNLSTEEFIDMPDGCWGEIKVCKWLDDSVIVYRSSTGNEIYGRKSLDDGNTWSEAEIISTDCEGMYSDGNYFFKSVQESGTGYISLYSYVEENWVKTTFEDTENVNPIDRVVSLGNGVIILANYTWFYSDDGVNFDKIYNSSAELDFSSDYEMIYNDTYSKVVAFNYDSVYISLDNCSTWTKCDAPGGDTYFYFASYTKAFIINDSVFILGSNSEFVYKNTDSNVWEKCYTYLPKEMQDINEPMNVIGVSNESSVVMWVLFYDNSVNMYNLCSIRSADGIHYSIKDRFITDVSNWSLLNDVWTKTSLGFLNLYKIPSVDKWGLIKIYYDKLLNSFKVNNEEIMELLKEAVIE